METTLNTNVPVIPVRNQGSPQVPGSAASAPALPLPRAEPTSVDLDVKLAEAQARREQAVRQAANSYVISDQRFTIYKDLSGQFITRFTSLRDGQVTYIPEPDVLSWLRQSGTQVNPTLSLDV